jgi:hypothetical protein
LNGSWGAVVDVVISDTLSAQEGMASVAKVSQPHQYVFVRPRLINLQLPNNQYIIVFESSQASNSSSATSVVNFKIAASPENAGTERVRDITTSSGLKPQGASFVTWSSVGGANGTIVLSDSITNSLFVNQALGEGPWKTVSIIAGRAYGREVRAGI